MELLVNFSSNILSLIEYVSKSGAKVDWNLMCMLKNVNECTHMHDCFVLLRFDAIC